MAVVFLKGVYAGRRAAILDSARRELTCQRVIAFLRRAVLSVTAWEDYGKRAYFNLIL